MKIKYQIMIKQGKDRLHYALFDTILEAKKKVYDVVGTDNIIWRKRINGVDGVINNIEKDETIFIDSIIFINGIN